MAPRKGSRAARPATAPAEQPPAGELTDTEREADDNAATARADLDQPLPAPAPVKKHRIRPAADETRPRAGGHVLTDHGWVPEG